MVRTTSLFLATVMGLGMVAGVADAQKGGKGGGGRGVSPGGAGAGGFKGGPSAKPVTPGTGGFKGGPSAKPATPGTGGFKGSTTPVNPGSGAFKGGTTTNPIRFASPATGGKLPPSGGVGNWQANTRNWQNFNHHQNQSRASFIFFPGFAGNHWYPYLFPYYNYYNYYQPYNYYGDGYQGGFSLGGLGSGLPSGQAPQQEPTDSAAHIRVLLADANAQVWFNGYKTSSTGTTRHFDTPALSPGITYFYKVKAAWTENNQPITEERDIQVNAGMRAVVDFTRTPVREVPPPKK